MLKCPRFIILSLSLLYICFNADPLLAHDSRPLHISVQEQLDGILRLKVNIPPSVAADNKPDVTLDCPRLDQRFDCRERVVFVLSIDYPDYNPALSSVINYVRVDGQQSIVTLGPAEMEWRSGSRVTLSQTLFNYGYLGVQHILIGFDHLLFLVLLIFIARRSLILTVTGFTVSHSLTLCLSALDYVSVSVPAIEVLIALSIIFLAAEIMRPRRDTLVWQHPFWITLFFGLIHGFGFASVLKEIGLPQSDLIMALAAFNIGVEVGQIIFLAGCFGITALGSMVGAMLGPHYVKAELRDRLAVSSVNWCAGFVGIIASFWLWSRIVAVL